MKFITFLITALLLISCGGEGTKGQTQPNTTKTNKQATPTPKAATKVKPAGLGGKDNLGPYPSQADMDAVNKPELSGPADIKVKINGMTSGVGKLVGFFGQQHYLADSSAISSTGEMRFKNPEGYAMGLYFILYQGNNYIQAMLGEDQQFEISADLSDLDGTMKSKGSIENEAFFLANSLERGLTPETQALAARIDGVAKGTPEYDKIKAQQVDMESKRRGLIQGVFKKYPNTLFTKFKKAGQNPLVRDGVSDQEKVYHYKNEFWNDVDFSDRRLARTPVIFNKLKRYFTELTAQNPDSIKVSIDHLLERVLVHPEYYLFFTNWILNTYEPTETTLMDPQAVYVHVMQNYFTHQRAFWADSVQIWGFQTRANEMALSLVGQIGPDVISTDQFGQKQSIFEKTSEYIIVYMYTPTCEHCQEQTPKLVQWYNQWKDKGADVYSIAIDTDDTEWKNYIKKTGMPFTAVHDPTNRSIYGKYFVDVTPELYVLNKERKIIGKNLKVNQIETIINQDKEKKANK